MPLSDEAFTPDIFPDGGVEAWLQAFAGFLVFFNPWGMINAFGAFETYYKSALPRFASDIAWIGTFQGFFLLFLSGLTGPLIDRGHLRILLCSGTFLMTYGMKMTSLSTKYYQVFLAQGVVVGIGGGLLSVPGLAIVAQWFSKRRGLATGIVAAGGSFGALLYSIIFERLQSQVSFGWATRIIGFIVLGTLTMSCVLLKPRVPPAEKARALIDGSAFRNLEFLGVTLAMFLYLMGLYVAVFYVSLYAQQALGIDDQLSFYLLSILNASSILGRMLPGPAADQFGPLSVMIPIVAITGILQLSWISVNSQAGIIVFCVFYGIFSGAYVTLLAALLAGIAPQVNKIGTWLGMNFGISSFGLLIGNPIAGALLKGGSFVPLQIFGGAMVFGGCFVFCIVRYIKMTRGIAWNMKA